MLQGRTGTERLYDDSSERDLDNLLKFHDALQAQIRMEGEQGQYLGQSPTGQGHHSVSEDEKLLDVVDDDSLLT